MMGTKLRTFGPLCNRSLEDLVPGDHFYRHLEAELDLGFVRDLVRSTYKECGRPSVDLCYRAGRRTVRPSAPFIVWKSQHPCNQGETLMTVPTPTPDGGPTPTPDATERPPAPTACCSPVEQTTCCEPV